MSSLDIRKDAVNHAILNSEQKKIGISSLPLPLTRKKKEKRERKKILARNFFFLFFPPKTKDDPFPPGGFMQDNKN